MTIDLVTSEWIHARLPRYDDRYVFDVWDGEYKREVRRVGNESLSITPGTLVYTDCSHPWQQAICCEADVVAWRIARTVPPHVR